MFIRAFPELRNCIRGQSIEVKLPRRGLKIDPKASFPNNVRFDCRYHDDDITVTLTRIDRFSNLFEIIFEILFDHIPNGECMMRIYDPAMEHIPKFDTTIYTYMGYDHERVPDDTTVAYIDQSVTTVKARAFSGCKKMKRCIMLNGVETIGKAAFSHCTSLDALFLPSSISSIQDFAFEQCTNMRILPLPIDIEMEHIEEGIMYGCDKLFEITGVQQYEEDVFCQLNNDDEILEEMLNFKSNLSPLHRACLDVNVVAETIKDCIVAHGSTAAHDEAYSYGGGITPLHILSMNPHANSGAILACFEANMDAAFREDDKGKTPLDYLKEYNVNSFLSMIQALCIHREASLPPLQQIIRHGMVLRSSKKRKRVN